MTNFKHALLIIYLLIISGAVFAADNERESPNRPYGDPCSALLLTMGVDLEADRTNTEIHVENPKNLEEPFDLPLKEKLKFFLPWAALTETWKVRDKRYFTFVENPLRGIPDQIPGLILGTLIGGGNYLSIETILNNFKDIYFPYQFTNFFRTGANLNKKLSDRMALVLNWYYSTISYGFFAAAPTFAAASTDEQYIHAWSLVAFSALWPLATQTVMRRHIVPLLYSGYPRGSELKQIYDKNISTEKLLLEAEENSHKYKMRVEELKANAESNQFALSPEKIKEYARNLFYSKEEYIHYQRLIEWIHFFRDGVENGKGVPLAKKVKFNSIKQWLSLKIATAAIILFFTTRYALVGDLGGDGWEFMSDHHLITEGVTYLYSLLTEGQALTASQLSEAVATVINITPK